MALPPLLKRRAQDAASLPTTDATELQARTRARRRLIGAAVLLVAGVIAFPLLFETQPRPVPVDIPMTIPSREGAAPLVVSPRPGRSDSGVIGAGSTSAAAAGSEKSIGKPEPTAALAPAVSAAPPGAKAIERPAAPAPAASAIPKAADKPAPRPEAKASSPVVAKPEAKPAAKAEAKVEPKAESKASAKTEAKADTKADSKADAKSGRWVVQVGAYADEASTREARQKVERLGLKTYTQEVEVQGVRRIRVRIGPFESVQEANKTLATLKAAKLPGAVLTL
jgi:DedD protein